MTQTNKMTEADQPSPLKICRTFHVPRAVVFKAWSSADHIRRWFCPANCTVPEARVEMRVGGVFEARMVGPEGIDHRIRGSFVEVSPHDRLVIDLHVSDERGRALMRAWTEVNFDEVVGGTRMEVLQTYTFADPSKAAAMVAGASQGWSETLDKLAAELGRMQGADTGARSVVHAVFTVERTYHAPAERVFRAFADETAKSKWFSGEAGRWNELERRMDFRVGGRERLKGRWDGGIVSTFDAVYHDIVQNERIIYTYEMHLDERKISVSLATLQLSSAGEGQTKLTITEQGAFLDGYDDGGSREHGTGHLLDRLGASLAT